MHTLAVVVSLLAGEADAGHAARGDIADDDIGAGRHGRRCGAVAHRQDKVRDAAARRAIRSPMRTGQERRMAAQNFPPAFGPGTASLLGGTALGRESHDPPRNRRVRSSPGHRFGNRIVHSPRDVCIRVASPPMYCLVNRYKLPLPFGDGRAGRAAEFERRETERRGTWVLQRVWTGGAAVEAKRQSGSRTGTDLQLHPRQLNDRSLSMSLLGPACADMLNLV